MSVQVAAERAVVSAQRGVTVVVTANPAHTAARVAAALGGQLAVGPLAARAAVAAAARSRRSARARLIGERILAAHVAAAVPDSVRRVDPAVVTNAARTVLEAERAAGAAAAATGAPPPFEPLADADARLAAAAVHAVTTRAERTRRRALGRDLAVANLASLALLGTALLLLAAGRGAASPLVAGLVVGAAVTTGAALGRAGWLGRRHRGAADRAAAALAAALARSGVSSLAELDERAAAHERWRRRRDRADRLANEAARLRRTWHELVGAVEPDDVAGLLAVAAWWREVAATTADAGRAARRPGRPIVAAVERDALPELVRAGAGVPLVVVCTR
jgi:hypothetical protein